MPVTIRIASLDDIPHIQAVAYATWPDTFGAILSPEQIGYMLAWMYDSAALAEQMREKGHVFLLAQDTTHGMHSPVGFAAYELGYAIDGAPSTITKLHKLYVLPPAQGTGAGRALVAAVVDAAATHAQNAVRLNVNRYNRAIGFYERYGFVTIATEDIDIGGGFYMNDVVMELRLAGLPRRDAGITKNDSDSGAIATRRT